MTIRLAGPAAVEAENALLADIAGRVFRVRSYGQPALLELLDDALATYDLAATARMLNVATEHGVPAKDVFEVIGASTGRSLMSDDLVDVRYDLLLENVGLLRGEPGSLPAGDVDHGIEPAILRARAPPNDRPPVARSRDVERTTVPPRARVPASARRLAKAHGGAPAA